jgi:hypothetical protein
MFVSMGTLVVLFCACKKPAPVDTEDARADDDKATSAS